MKRIFSILLLFALLTNVFSQSVEDLEKLGGDKMANGLYSEALDYYKQAITLIGDETSHSTTYAYAGMCASEMGDVATAKAYFINSIERGIEEPRIFDMLGELGRKEKDYATHNFLQWYVGEQHEEEMLFQGIVDKIKMIGTENKGLFFIDKEILSLATGTAPAAE